MKNIIILLLGFCFASNTAWARDTHHNFPVKDVIELGQSNGKLSIPFYFGKQKPKGKVIKKFGEFSSNKKTNAFGKSDEEACRWAMLSALISLQERTLKEGGNAVINIKSNYRDKETVSSTTYRCGAGAIMAGTALKGTIVKLKK